MGSQLARDSLPTMCIRAGPVRTHLWAPSPSLTGLGLHRDGPLGCPPSHRAAAGLPLKSPAGSGSFLLISGPPLDLLTSPLYTRPLLGMHSPPKASPLNPLTPVVMLLWVISISRAPGRPA